MENDNLTTQILDSNNIADDNENYSDSPSGSDTVSDLSANDVSDGDTAAIANDVVIKLLEYANSTDSDYIDEENSNETTAQPDYSQQLSDINTTINGLRTDLNSLSESVDDVRDSVTLQPVMPDDYYTYTSTMLGFNGFALGLSLGLLIVLIFIKGLKK